MVECNKVMLNDYRGYLVNLEIEQYCQCKLSKHDKPRHTMLNNTKKSHVEKFNKRVNQMISQLNVQQRVIEVQHLPSREAYNYVDKLFATVLNKA